VNVDPRVSTRLVWCWCVAYTAVAPAPSRDRRRAELRSHLWEFERAGLPARALCSAAVRGLVSDVAWALATRTSWLATAARAPSFYVVLAALFPLQGAVASAVLPGGQAGRLEAVGAVGGPALLVAAGVAWLIERRHSRGDS
jgi:hypothetical protein